MSLLLRPFGQWWAHVSWSLATQTVSSFSFAVDSASVVAPTIPFSLRSFAFQIYHRHCSLLPTSPSLPPRRHCLSVIIVFVIFILFPFVFRRRRVFDDFIFDFVFDFENIFLLPEKQNEREEKEQIEIHYFDATAKRVSSSHNVLLRFAHLFLFLLLLRHFCFVRSFAVVLSPTEIIYSCCDYSYKEDSIFYKCMSAFSLCSFEWMRQQRSIEKWNGMKWTVCDFLLATRSCFPSARRDDRVVPYDPNFSGVLCVCAKTSSLNKSIKPFFSPIFFDFANLKCCSYLTFLDLRACVFCYCCCFFGVQWNQNPP